MLDPNVPLPSFDEQTIAAERQRKLADFLRQRANTTAMPQGNLVSGRYVRPSFTQYLGPLLDKLNAGTADRQATEAEIGLNKAQTTAANQWRAAMPQETPAVPREEDIMGNTMVQQQEAQPVTRDAILKYTMAGLNNPKTAKEAVLVNQSLMSDLTRKEDQAFRDLEARKAEVFRANESALARQQRADDAAKQLEFRKEQLESQLRLQQLTIEQRGELAKQHDATMRELGLARIEAQKAASEATRASAELNRTLAGQRFDQAKKQDLQSNIEQYVTRTKDLVPLHQSMQAVQTIFDKYDNDPKKIPGIGYSTLLSPLARKEDANVVQRQVKAFANAVTRGQAGLSQTLSEQANVDLETMASGKFSAKEFMRSWPEIMAKYNSMITAQNASIDPETLGTYLKRGGYKLQEVKAAEKPTNKALPKATGQTPKFTIEEVK